VDIIFLYQSLIICTFYIYMVVLFYSIVKWIKGQRIGRLGHLERMEEDRLPKKIFTQELEGTRRRGRHRKRWKGEVERDLQVLGVRRWRELVADRKKWKDIVRQAIVGCSAN